MFYTYVHTRASDSKPFYVGKGQHHRAYSLAGRNPHWCRTVAKHGLKIDIAARWPTEQEAFEHEKFLILCFKDLGMPLANLTGGGEGLSTASAETRAKLRASTKALMALPGDHHMRGKKHTEEARAKTSAALTGRVFSQETLEKMRDSHKGKAVPKDVCKKIGASNSGKALSDEHRAKISVSRMGQTLSDATRAKLSASHMGNPVSEATRQKISAFWKAKRAEKLSKQLAEGATV